MKAIIGLQTYFIGTGGWKALAEALELVHRICLSQLWPSAEKWLCFVLHRKALALFSAILAASHNIHSHGVGS